MGACNVSLLWSDMGGWFESSRSSETVLLGIAQYSFSIDLLDLY